MRVDICRFYANLCNCKSWEDCESCGTTTLGRDHRWRPDTDARTLRTGDPAGFEPPRVCCTRSREADAPTDHHEGRHRGEEGEVSRKTEEKGKRQKREIKKGKKKLKNKRGKKERKKKEKKQGKHGKKEKQ